MSCAHVCPICALEKPTCATKSKRSTTSSPTARPISSSPPTSKASSPSSTPRLNCPPLTNANACCGCSAKTFSSDPTRSPSGTVSRSGNAPPTTPNPPPTPTRRTTMPDIAHCVGGVISPLLANLFMHYAFDTGMAREFPTIPFERYCDDAVVHCGSEAQARQVQDAIAARLEQVGLQLHPDKTRVVYCKDAARRDDHEVTSFVFLGYGFRPRLAKSRTGHHFVSFLPAVSTAAKKAMSAEIRSWHLARRSDKSLDDLARMFNNIVQGWINYYGRFYRSELLYFLRRLNMHLVRWATRKYQRR